MFERYNDQARRALFFARYEASQIGGASIDKLLGIGPDTLNAIREEAREQAASPDRFGTAQAHRHIGTEHLLLGILREEDSENRAWLTRHGIQVHAVRDAARKSGPEA